MALRLSCRCLQMPSTLRFLLKSSSRNHLKSIPFCQQPPAFTSHLYPDVRRYSINLSSEEERLIPEPENFTETCRFKSNENKHALSVLCRSKEFQDAVFKLSEPPKEDTELNPDDISQSTWNGKPHELVNQFEHISNQRRPQELGLDDELFTPMIEALSSNLKEMNEGEIFCLLKNLLKWRRPLYSDSSNFFKLLEAIDHECSCRVNHWSRSQLLYFLLPLYFLGALRKSNFARSASKKIGRKISSLSVDELLQLLFYMSIMRSNHPALKPRDIEFGVINNFSKFSLDELGVIALGFFKTQSRILEPKLINAIIKKLCDELDQVSSFTLAAILKTTTYSGRCPSTKHILHLLDQLAARVEKYSMLEITQIANLASKWRSGNVKLYEKFANTLRQDLKSARLKDIHRTLHCLVSYQYESNENPSIYEMVLDEIRSPKREAELFEHPKYLELFVSKLSTISLYPEDLIAKVFSKEHLHHAYGKKLTRFNLPAHLLQIHYAVSIENPGYQGPLLDPELAESMSEHHGWFMPRKTGSPGDRMMVDVNDLVAKILGGDDYTHFLYTLPSYLSSDVIFCLDEETNKPVPIPEDVRTERRSAGVVPSNRGRWHCIYGISYETFLAGTTRIEGHVQHKGRLLSRIGWKPILWKAPFRDWMSASDQEKEQMVRELLSGIS